MSTSDTPYGDLEQGLKDWPEHERSSGTVLAWKGVGAKVRTSRDKRGKDILSNVNGYVKAGELVALMGPSGSGKSTLLNILAHRPSELEVQKEEIRLSYRVPENRTIRQASAYVEQEDALVGSLTVRETLQYTAMLALPHLTATRCTALVSSLLADFGLTYQADSFIGTPFEKGISGGQKRRVSVACQMITEPDILFLDEPTSGLDSAAAYEVISCLRNVASNGIQSTESEDIHGNVSRRMPGSVPRRSGKKVIVIAAIHQPSTSILSMFNQMLLLSEGKVVYNGPTTREILHNYILLLLKGEKQVGPLEGIHATSYLGRFSDQQYPLDPSEEILMLANRDFRGGQDLSLSLEKMVDRWKNTAMARKVAQQLESQDVDLAMGLGLTSTPKVDAVPLPRLLWTLVRRSFLKSYRDVVAYGIRIGMYLGLSFLMGTIWLRLEASEDNIQAFINAIFFGGAFMSFMAVAYIPAYLEDRALFMKERANGLYGPTPFILANILTSTPYLLFIAVAFSTVAYWLSNFRPTPSAFFIWIGWLFLDLLAAEALVVLISSLVPIFVVALATTAFANGLWMCTGGFLVQANKLNAFWRYLFHTIDYQFYVFQGMMINEFGNRNYTCGLSDTGKCQCHRSSALKDHCLVDGNAILQQYGFSTAHARSGAAVMIGLILGYRLLTWIVLWKRRT